MEETRRQTVFLQTISPHSRTQEIIMRSFLDPNLREVFVACGTKFGKSISAATALTNCLAHRGQGTYRWMAPIYRQAKIGMDYFAGIAPPPPYRQTITSQMLMKFPDINANLEFWHTNSPVDLEGAGVSGQVGDEAAKMPEQAYTSANTTTTFTKGLSMWISTPWGKNWFYKRFMAAKEHMEWSIARGKSPTKIALHAPTQRNPLISDAVIQQARNDMTDRMFRQYFLAEFLDDGSVFINFRNCLRGLPLLFEGRVQEWFHPDSSELDVVMGIDWAKHQDFTVMIAIDPSCNPRRVVGFMRFQDLAYTTQVREMWNFSKKFKSIGLGYHDKTGVGVAVDDMIAPIPVHCVGITFTNPMKSEMINKLGLTFEREGLELPNWPEMLKELDAFEVKINNLGTTIYNAPVGDHDDIVMALGLANLAADEYSGEMKLNYLEDLPDKVISELDKYYLDMQGDDDDPW